MTVLSMRDYIIFVSLCFSLTLFYLPVNLSNEYTIEEEFEKIPSREILTRPKDCQRRDE